MNNAQRMNSVSPHARLLTAAVACLVIAFCSCTTASNNAISWKQAPHHLGQHKTVDGVVIGSHKADKAIFLNFSENWKRDCTIVIFERDFGNWPDADPAALYKGKRIRATGTIRNYKDRVEIIVASPKQIEIVK